MPEHFLPEAEIVFQLIKKFTCPLEWREGKCREHKEQPRPSLGELGNCRRAEFANMLEISVLLPKPVRVCEMTNRRWISTAANIAASPPPISLPGKGSTYFRVSPTESLFPCPYSSSFLSRSLSG